MFFDSAFPARLRKENVPNLRISTLLLSETESCIAPTIISSNLAASSVFMRL
jgi:hypothetical protein